MSELEDLPSWAGRSTDAQQPAAEAGAEQVHQSDPPAEAPPADYTAAPRHAGEDEPRRRSPWLVALLGLFGIAALLGLGALGYFLASSQDSTETTTDADATDDGAAAADDDEGQLGSEEAAGDTDADATADSDSGSGTAGETGDGATETSAEGDDTVTVEVDDSDDADPDAEGSDAAAGEGDDATSTAGEDGAANDSGRQAIFRGGKVYLSGAVPSEEIGQLIEQKAAAVVGPENVVNEYTIDPAAEIRPGDSAPLYVEDVILFEFNSVAISEPFLPILDLGVLLLRQNPQATITVVTRTDAVGSEEVNLEVSRQRANAVVNYWLSKGVDSAQIVADPRGEEGASEEDDEETAARNRRAEFIITGLLD